MALLLIVKFEIWPSNTRLETKCLLKIVSLQISLIGALLDINFEKLQALFKRVESNLSSFMNSSFRLLNLFTFKNFMLNQVYTVYLNLLSLAG